MSIVDPKWTIEKKSAFLEHLRTTCNVGKSAEAVEISRSTVYNWRQEDPVFAEQIEQAKRDAVEALEDEAHRRAFEGSLKITKHGTYLEYSDTLAIFLLKAHAPEKYMDKVRSELTGPNGEPLNMSDEQISAKLGAIMQAALARRDKTAAPPPEDSDDDFSDLC